MQKKGQAAMEFLMTYGWAILAAIVVIGILGYYYFGSDILTPSTGIVSPPFYLNAQSVSTTTASLEIKNNGGETYNVTSIVIDPDSDDFSCSEYTTSTELEAGEMDVFEITCSGTSDGDTFKGDITISYRKPGSEIDQISTGSITESVTAAA